MIEHNYLFLSLRTYKGETSRTTKIITKSVKLKIVLVCTKSH